MRALERAPQVEHPLYWNSFSDCSTMRVSGMGLGPVPVDKLYWYAEHVLGLWPNEARAFVWIMRALDARFIELQADQRKRAARS